MKPFIVKDVGKFVLSRCGDNCNTRTNHKVMIYEYEGKKYLALGCMICSTVTITFVPYPTEKEHGNC